MHEDSMDAKNLRPSGATSEVKTNKSDASVLVGKVQNRNGKKRENPSTSVWSAPAVVGGAAAIGFKSQQPKPKGADKRKKSKARYCEVGASYKNDYQMKDEGESNLDLDPMISEGRKKQNLAHMLNMKFQLAPRDTMVSPYWRATHSGGVGDKGRRFYGSSFHGRGHLSKDHYLQANCQFVVKARGDYSVYLADPDLLVPWECVEQIRIWDSEFSSCPICLHSPVAARLTRCGHVYCWPCILHFLALSDKPSRPCPICDAPIHIADLRSVLALEQLRLKVGDTLEMRLMKRDRHSLEPQPISRTDRQTCRQPMNFAQAGEHHVFSKLLLCSPEDVISLIISGEREELESQLEAEKDCPESCFIQQALEQLALREKATIAECDLNTAEAGLEALTVTEEQPSDNAKADCATSDLASRSRYTSTSSDGTLDSFGGVVDDYGGAACASMPIRSRAAQEGLSTDRVGGHQPKQQLKNTFYFYQSSDGQAIFLHPLNIQMLVQCYGSLEFCPEVIQGKIVEVETFSMTEELRNRLRYLGHIPIFKQFQIMEISLAEPIVDPEVLESFRDRIEDRERRRRKKDREERRRDLEIQRAEEAKWGRSKAQPLVRLDSQVHFPQFSPTSEHDPPLSMSPQSTTTELPECPDQHGPSFAQMLRDGKNKSVHNWAPLPRKQTTASAIGERAVPYSDTSEQDLEDYTPAPAFRDTFSSALAAAFDQAATSTGGDELPVGSSTNKKGKKSKKKILFSTGMNFM